MSRQARRDGWALDTDKVIDPADGSLWTVASLREDRARLAARLAEVTRELEEWRREAACAEDELAQAGLRAPDRREGEGR